ncbi:MAG: hypothetical protein HXY34_01770 [Candidatus Thorarchaeota archaeon]|nr:hypothetical protein [Candidatus Thorarchaeota archaeon]
MQLELLLGGLLMIVAIFIIISIIIYAIFLGIALGFVNGTNRELGTTFVTALGMALLGWIPLLGCVISWYLIKTRHGVGWGGAIVAWLLCMIISAIAFFVILLLIPGGLAILFGALMPTTFTFP